MKSGSSRTSPAKYLFQLLSPSRRWSAKAPVLGLLTLVALSIPAPAEPKFRFLSPDFFVPVSETILDQQQIEELRVISNTMSFVCLPTWKPNDFQIRYIHYSGAGGPSGKGCEVFLESNNKETWLKFFSGGYGRGGGFNYHKPVTFDTTVLGEVTLRRATDREFLSIDDVDFKEGEGERGFSFVTFDCSPNLNLSVAKRFLEGVRMVRIQPPHFDDHLYNSWESSTGAGALLEHKNGVDILNIFVPDKTEGLRKLGKAELRPTGDLSFEYTSLDGKKIIGTPNPQSYVRNEDGVWEWSWNREGPGPGMKVRNEDRSWGATWTPKPLFTTFLYEPGRKASVFRSFGREHSRDDPHFKMMRKYANFFH